MKMQALRPQVAVQLLLWGAIECWQLARARLALQRLGAGHDSVPRHVPARHTQAAPH